VTGVWMGMLSIRSGLCRTPARRVTKVAPIYILMKKAGVSSQRRGEGSTGSTSPSQLTTRDSAFHPPELPGRAGGSSCSCA